MKYLSLAIYDFRNSEFSEKRVKWVSLNNGNFISTFLYRIQLFTIGNNTKLLPFLTKTLMHKEYLSQAVKGENSGDLAGQGGTVSWNS